MFGVMYGNIPVCSETNRWSYGVCGGDKVCARYAPGMRPGRDGAEALRQLWVTRRDVHGGVRVERHWHLHR